MDKQILVAVIFILFALGTVALVLAVCNYQSIGFSYKPGSPGQVLTVGNNGRLTWVTPQNGTATEIGTVSPSSLGISRFYGTTLGTGSLGNDYSATVAAGAPVPFPRDGFISGGITRINTTSFLLPIIGTYEITWSLQTTESGQLQLSINNGDGFALVASSVVCDSNPTEGGHVLAGSEIITTTSNNAVVMVVNPPGNSPALTVTPADGFQTHANAPFLIIERIV